MDNYGIFCAWATFLLSLSLPQARGAHIRSRGVALTDYSITPSSQVAYYHYPAPSRPGLSYPQQQSPGAYAHQSRQYQPQSRAHQQQAYYQPQQYQQQSQQQYHPQHQQQYHPQHQQQYHRQQPVVTKFSSPALESAAFTMALTSHGYAFRSTGSSDARSLNVKLPLPFGVTPIKLGPLPLQAGAPYDSIPRDVTSYGTPHPLRR